MLVFKTYLTGPHKTGPRKCLKTVNMSSPFGGDPKTQPWWCGFILWSKGQSYHNTTACYFPYRNSLYFPAGSHLGGMGPTPAIVSGHITLICNKTSVWQHSLFLVYPSGLPMAPTAALPLFWCDYPTVRPLPLLPLLCSSSRNK